MDNPYISTIKAEWETCPTSDWARISLTIKGSRFKRERFVLAVRLPKTPMVTREYLRKLVEHYSIKSRRRRFAPTMGGWAFGINPTRAKGEEEFRCTLSYEKLQHGLPHYAVITVASRPDGRGPWLFADPYVLWLKQRKEPASRIGETGIDAKEIDFLSNKLLTDPTEEAYWRGKQLLGEAEQRIRKLT